MKGTDRKEKEPQRGGLLADWWGCHRRVQRKQRQGLKTMWTENDFRTEGYKFLAGYWVPRTNENRPLIRPTYGSFPDGSDGEESACNAGDPNFIPGLGRFPGWREWQPTPVLLPGEEFYGQRRLAGYSPWGCKELGTTERLILSRKLLNMRDKHGILQLCREEPTTTKNYVIRKLKNQIEFVLPSRNPGSSETWSDAFTLPRKSSCQTGILFQPTSVNV